MKLSTATGSFPPNMGSEEAIYKTIAEAGYSYVNYDFPNFSQKEPAYMDYVQDNLGDLKPGVGTHVNDMHTLPLFGTTHYDIVIRTLKEIGYNGYFNFETDRPKWKDFKVEDQLQHIMPEVKKHVLCLEHAIGRLMLQAYDCYEE